MAEMDPQHTKWVMVIDLDRCNGCGACVTACAMENNVAFTGEEENAYGRGMHWMRIVRYWVGEWPNVQVRFMPMLCQQCSNAPCEPVCPVFATMHSEAQELNSQVYNRCIGTRYCANNCPYIARTFNWFDYEWPEPLNFHLNPDVTVRRRGIMEKCTFCIQRIRAAEEEAKMEGRPVRDGEVQPACAQACPTEAIVFGNWQDPNSKVRELAESQRGFRFLEELGTEPKVIYLSSQKHEF